MLFFQPYICLSPTLCLLPTTCVLYPQWVSLLSTPTYRLLNSVPLFTCNRRQRQMVSLSVLL